MLIRFNIRNFLSFNKQDNGKSEEFSMIAGKVKSKEERLYKDENIKLLKFAALYGANASGKSNFIKALRFMQKTIVFGELPTGYSNLYCKVNETNKTEESYFEVQLMVDNKYYLYGFTVLLSSGDFLSEWLYEINAKSEKRIFERDIKQGILEFDLPKDEELALKFKVYTDDIKHNSNQLFLYFMNDNKENLYKTYKESDELYNFKKVYEWFEDILDINYPDRPMSSSLYFTNEEKLKKASELLKSFDTGIEELKLIDIPMDNISSEVITTDIIKQVINNMEIQLKSSKNINSIKTVVRNRTNYFIFSGTDINNLKYQSLKFKHNNIPTLFDLIEESDGIIRILDLLDIILSEEKKVYIIDELDKCLHPNLTYKFIQTFFEYVANKLDVQLIITTHESRLLDFNLLRRDEIWFVDKKPEGNCNMYSLDEYNVRADKKIDEAYLNGRYGGIPLFCYDLLDK